MTTTSRGPKNPLTLTAPAAIVAGQGLLIGGIFGVVANAAASGEKFSLYIEGEYLINKLASDNPVEGSPLYWDNTSTPKRLTLTVGSNKLVGYCTVAPAASATTVVCVLVGI